MNRYQINIGKKPQEIEKDSISPFESKIILPKNRYEADISGLISKEEAEYYLGDHAENCFKIASQITGNKNSTVPTANTMAITIQLMHLPDSIAGALCHLLHKK